MEYFSLISSITDL